MDQVPVLTPSVPLFRNIHHRQIQHFQQAVVRWEDGFCLGDFSQLAVEALDGISRIDQPPDFLGILEIYAQIRPIFLS